MINVYLFIYSFAFFFVFNNFSIFMFLLVFEFFIAHFDTDCILYQNLVTHISDLELLKLTVLESQEVLYLNFIVRSS